MWTKPEPKFSVGQEVVLVDMWDDRTRETIEEVVVNPITGVVRYRLEGSRYSVLERELVAADEGKRHTENVIPVDSRPENFDLMLGTILLWEGKFGRRHLVKMDLASNGSIPHFIQMKGGLVWTIYDLANQSACGEVFEVVGGMYDAL